MMEGPDQVLPAESFVSCNVREPVKLRLADEGPASQPPVSIPTVLQQAAKRWPDRHALCVKRGNIWENMSFREYYRTCRLAGRAFISCGVQEYDGIALIGFNAPEYFIANIGGIMAGAVTTGMYTTSSEQTCQFYLTNTSVSAVVVENDKYLQKILAIRTNCPLVHTIIQYTGEPTTEGVLSWQQFLDKANSCEEEELERRLLALAVNRCATVIYTSGTTGEPKGVMISHDIMTWTAQNGANLSNIGDGVESLVSYLPLSHGAAQIVDIYLAITRACTVYFAKPDALKGSLVETLREVRPTQLFGVPRIWEKFHEKLESVFNQGGLQMLLINWCRQQSISYWQSLQKNPSAWTSLTYYLFESVLRRIRLRIGLDRLNCAITVAAPISEEVITFMHSLNVPLFEMYGLSETCGPSTVNNKESFKVGSVGRVFADCSIKIKDEDEHGVGELLHKGRNVFMGYMNREKATVDSIDKEGWFMTGDLARIDDDGFVYITGRLKELLVTAGGKNIAPVPIEDAVKSELSIISNVMVIGDSKKFLSALFTAKVTPDEISGEPTDVLTPETVKWLSQHGATVHTVNELIDQIEKLKPAIQKGVNAANAKADSQACWIKEWRFLKRDFSIAGGELGPTLKLRRQVVSSKYQEIIDSIYSA